MAAGEELQFAKTASTMPAHMLQFGLRFFESLVKETFLQEVARTMNFPPTFVRLSGDKGWLWINGDEIKHCTLVDDAFDVMLNALRTIVDFGKGAAIAKSLGQEPRLMHSPEEIKAALRLLLSTFPSDLERVSAVQAYVEGRTAGTDVALRRVIWRRNKTPVLATIRRVERRVNVGKVLYRYLESPQTCIVERRLATQKFVQKPLARVARFA